MKERRDKNGVFINEKKGKNDEKWGFSVVFFFRKTTYFLGL